MADDALERFRSLLRSPTQIDRPDELAAMPGFIAALYPRVHDALERELIGDRGILYRWPGGDPALAPLVLMAHYDVVPAADEGWTHPPYAAELVGEGDEAVLWGRGAIDDKGALAGILEAVDRLLAEGFSPVREVLLCFGGDEESYGHGAVAIVDELERRGIRPALVLDEGGAVVADAFPGVTTPAAAVGVSEKGIVTVRLTVEQRGGHASTPPRLAATVRIARALTRLERHPFPASMHPVTQRMLEAVGVHASGALGAAMRRAGALRPVLTRALARLGDETRAMVRTTMAVTQLAGSAAPNVLAERASAVVNVRIAVGSSVAEVERHIRRAIADPLVTVTLVDPSEPSPVSPYEGEQWDAITAALAIAYPDAALVPYIMYAASDGRHYTRVSDAVYRFTPFRMSRDERSSLHAIDERIRVATWREGIRFYEELVRAF